MALTRVNGNLITSGTITGNLFLNNTITGDKIGLTAITSNLIASAAVTGDKIGLTAITSNLIASAAVTGDKIGLTAITSNLIATGVTLTSPVLASANLTTALTLAGATGNSGQVLTSAGSGLPTWSTPSSGAFGSDLSYEDYFLTTSSALDVSVSAVPFLEALSLDGTSELILLGASSSLHAVVYNTSTDTFGTPILIRTGNFSTSRTIAEAKINVTSVLVCSLPTTNTALETVVLTISGSTITVGTALTTTLAATSSLVQANTRLVAVGSSFVLNYFTTANSLPKFRAITVSGTTPSIGSELAYTGGTLASQHHSYAHSANTLLHLSMTEATTIFVLPITVSGTSLTAGTAATTAITNSTFMISGVLDNSRYALHFVNTTGKGAVISVAGSAASINIASNTTSVGSFSPSMQVFGNQAIIVNGGASSNFNVITDTGGVATLGTDLAVPAAGIPIGFLSTGKIFFATSASGDSSYYQIGISSGSAVLEKTFQNMTTTYSLSADQIVQTPAGYGRPLSGLSRTSSGAGAGLRTSTGKVCNGTSSTFPFTLSFDGTVQAKIQQSANRFTAYNDGISTAVVWGMPGILSASATNIQLRKVTLV